MIKPLVYTEEFLLRAVPENPSWVELKARIEAMAARTEDFQGTANGLDGVGRLVGPYALCFAESDLVHPVENAVVRPRAVQERLLRARFDPALPEALYEVPDRTLRVFFVLSAVLLAHFDIEAE